MKPFTKSVAVLVGINQYGNGINRLRTPIADVERLGAILADKHGYAVEPIVKNATKAELQTLLARLPALATRGARLLFYFAGHGLAEDSQAEPAGYLVPSDARHNDLGSCLPMRELYQALLQIKCRHVLIILDCCFAGRFRWAITRSLARRDTPVFRSSYARFVESAAWQVITSSAHNQEALDVLGGLVIGQRNAAQEQLHSPFAQALISGLEDGAADISPAARDGKPAGDGIITATELYLYVNEAVAQKSHRQTPGLWLMSQHDHGEYLFFHPNRPPKIEEDPPLDVASNPYLGLDSYDAGSANLLFGRSAVISALAQRVAEDPLTVVIGQSGSGKSSVVMAGLLPLLEHQKDPSGNYTWAVTAPLRPGKSPLSALATLALPGWRDTDEPVAHSYGERLAFWHAQNPTKRLVIAVDQLEELITQATAPGDRSAFCAALEDALVRCSSFLRIVLIIRADAEATIMNTALSSRWLKARYEIPAMSREELRRAIEGPAEARALHFQPHALVDRLIDDVMRTPSPLPLLSFTLHELYLLYLDRHRTGGPWTERALTEDDYDKLGGVAGALGRRADSEFEKLPTAQLQETMRRTYLRMISLQAGVPGRWRLPRAELTFDDAEENTRVDEVLLRLTAARLIVPGQEADGTPSLELAHDALIHNWKYLQDWLRNWAWLERRSVVLSWAQRRRLIEDARHWEQQAATVQSEPGLAAMDLRWHGNPSLPLALREQQRERWAFNAVETRFLKESRTWQQIRSRRIWTSVAMAFLALAAFAATAFFLYRLSDERRQISEAQRLAAQVRVETGPRLPLASLLALESYRSRPDSVEGRGALLQMLQTHPALVAWHDRHYESEQLHRNEAVAFSASGALVASGGANRLVVLMDVASGRIVQETKSDHYIDCMAFSPDGKALVFGGTSEQNALTVYDLESHRSDKLRNPAGFFFQKVAFTRDGKWLIAAGQDARLVIWSWPVRAGAAVLLTLSTDKNPNNHATAIALSAESNSIAVGAADGFVRRYSIPHGEPLPGAFQAAREGPVLAVALHPQQPLVAVGTRDAGIKLWELGTGAPAPQPLADNESAVHALEFSPDGRLLAAAREQRGIQVWDFASRHRLTTLDQNNYAAALTFSSAGSRLAAAGWKGFTTVWDVEAFQSLAVPLTRNRSGVIAATWDARGDLIATVQDSRIHVWKRNHDSPDIPAFRELPVADDSEQIWMSAIAFQSASERVAAVGEDGITVRELALAAPGTSAMQPRKQQLAAAQSDAGGGDAAVPPTDAAVSPIENLRRQQELELQIVKRELALDPAALQDMGPARQRKSELEPELEVRQTRTVAIGSQMGNGRAIAFVPDTLGSDPYGDCFRRNTPRSYKSLDLLAFLFREGKHVVMPEPLTDRWSVGILRSSGSWQVWSLAPGSARLRANGSFQSQGPEAAEPVTAAAIRRRDCAIAWATRSGLHFTLSGWSRGEPQRQSIRDEHINRVAFSPDGDYLIWGDSQGGASYRKIDTPGAPVTRVSVSRSVHALAFNHAGTLLAVGDEDGNITLWDTASAQQIGVPLRSLWGEPVVMDVIRSLSFSPDDSYLLSASDRAGGVLWDMRPDAWARRVQRLVLHNLDLADWQQFFGPHTPYRRTLAELPPGSGIVAESRASLDLTKLGLFAAALLLWLAVASRFMPWNHLHRPLAHPGSFLLAVILLVGLAALIFFGAQKILLSPTWLDHGAIHGAIFCLTTALSALLQWFLRLRPWNRP